MSQNEIPSIHFFQFFLLNHYRRRNWNVTCNISLLLTTSFGDFISSISFQGLFQQYKHMSKPLQLTLVFFKWELLLYFILNIYYLSWFGWRVGQQHWAENLPCPKRRPEDTIYPEAHRLKFIWHFWKLKSHIIYMILVIRKRISDNVPLVKGTYLPCVNHSFPLLSESGKKIIVRSVF